MIVQIESISSIGESIYITFLNEFGKANARAFFGSTLSPRVGDVYSAELNIDDSLEWGRDICVADQEHFSIEANAYYTSLNGIFEAYDDDAYTVLRMGDYVIPFTSNGQPLDIGSFVKVDTKAIEIYTIDY